MNDAIHRRTTTGTQEVLAKSGRLTQSERLLLILLGEPMTTGRILLRVPSLSSDRIERALGRLRELGLVETRSEFEPVERRPAPRAIAADDIRAFLQQTDDDPKTVLTPTELLEQTGRLRALHSALERVLPATTGTEATLSRTSREIPLSAVFPETQPATVTRPRPSDVPDVEALRRLRKRASEAIEHLETELEGRRRPRFDGGAGNGPSAGKKRKRRRRPAGTGGRTGLGFGWIVAVAVAVAAGVGAAATWWAK